MELEFVFSMELIIIFLTMVLFTLRYWPNKYNPLRFYALFTVHCLFYIIFSTLLLPICLFRPKNPSNNMIFSYISKLIIWFLTIHFELRNQEIIEKDEGFVIVANHQSSLDALGIFQIASSLGKFAIVVKKELMYLFPLGLTTYLCGHVFIDRKHKESAIKQLNITEKLMNKNKVKVIIYPEGTRNTSKESMLEFKKGAFIMAINAQVPVVPIVYSPYYFISREKKFFDSNGKIIITALDPITTEGMTLYDVPRLMKMTRDRMLEQYMSLKQEVSEYLPDDHPFIK